MTDKDKAIAAIRAIHTDRSLDRLDAIDQLEEIGAEAYELAAVLGREMAAEE